MADDAKKQADEARRKLKEDRDAREKVAKESAGSGPVKPTPTQEENDLAAMGVPITEHEEDGSQKDSRPVVAPSRGGYQTREAGHKP